MPDETRYVAAIGPLYNVPLVVVGVAFTAAAWFNGLELLLTTLATFKKRSAYFYSLIVTSFGVLCFQSGVFCMIFVPSANAYGIIGSIDVGWTCMVTGQSMVLWSRLHLVCRSRWKLRAVLIMIISSAILCHGTQTVCSLLAIQDNVINPDYPPFVYTEKVSLCIFCSQEVIISILYIWETVKILRLASAVKQGSRHRRMRNLFLANIAILALDVCLLSLEFAALWGVWCTFKGFAYSIKLKIEFAILSQLRETITKPPISITGGATTPRRAALSERWCQQQRWSHGIHAENPLASCGNRAECFRTGLEGRDTARSEDHDRIIKTTEYTVSRLDGGEIIQVVGPMTRSRPRSPSSSEIDFATKGA